MGKKPREFQIFVKPVGARCNLQCSYCYYLKTEKLYSRYDPPLMPDVILEAYISQHIEAAAEKAINFSWHGGEPMLAGIDFFRKAVALQKKYLPEGHYAVNGIQTNGTLINEEWCRFLSDENFITGISIDGPGDLHNRLRISGDKKSTLNRVLNGYELLKKHNILTEILCVVNAANVKYPLVVYDFFRELEAKYITFLPLVEPRLHSPSGVSPDSVPAEDFGFFLSSVFDEWKERDIGGIKIQIFEEALRTAFDQDHTLCIFKENCGGVPVVEHNGDFYSCDHFVDRDHLIGNILDGSLAAFLESEKQLAFGRAKSDSLPEYCLKCEVRHICNGECPKNRFACTPDGQPGLNYLCRGYRHFFNHCRPFIEAIRQASDLFSK